MDNLLLDPSKIRIERFANPDPILISQYMEKFDSVFGYTDPLHRPTDMFLAYQEDEAIAFISFTKHNESTMYIQYCGVIPGYRGEENAFIFEECAKRLAKEGFPNMVCFVEQMNVRAIKKGLTVGFYIIGCRQYPNQNLYVELLQNEKL